MRRLLPIILALFTGLLSTETTYSQAITVYNAPVEDGSTTGARGPNGTSAHAFMRASTIVTATELAGITTGTDILSLGFSYAQGATSAVTGNIKVYMLNTTDATYTRGSDWTTIITGMTLVYDGPMTIPTTATTIDLTLTTPFNYTGGGINIAYDFESAGPYATTGATYRANSSMTGSLVSGASATAAPTTLAATTAFRPSFRFRFTNPFSNEVSVDKIFTLGETPILLGHSNVMAIVRNAGSANKTNLAVTLNVTGANTYSNTITIPSLPAGELDTVVFTGFMPTSTGANSVTVSVPADEKNTNNSRTYRHEVTCNSFSYADTTSAISGLGFANSTGILAVRYSIRSGQTTTVKAVDIQISNDAATVGKTVYAVVFKSDTTIAGQSANYVVTTADLGKIHRFLIPTTPTVTGNFYVGLAQTQGATPAAYYPVATQAEAMNYPNAYFLSNLAGAKTSFTSVSGYNRWVIKAVTGSTGILELTSSDADNTICSGDAVTLTATSGFTSYNFMINGTSAQNTTSNTFTSSALANADVVKVASMISTCSDTSNTMAFTVEVCTNLEAIAKNEAKFNLYPNPTEGGLTIESGMENLSKVEVSNILGQVVYFENVSENNGKINLNLAGLPKGIYSVKLSSPTKDEVKSVILK